MKSQFVSELKEGQTVKEKFILAKKIVKEKRDGGYYAILELADRTGSIDAISWDGDLLSDISTDDFVFVIGNVAEYSGRLQVVVNSIRAVAEDDIDAVDFLPQYQGNLDAVMGDLCAFKERVENTYLRRLLDSFFEDQEFMSLLRLAPAAKIVHHAYLGGLAVHTLSVLKVLDSLVSVYEFLDTDLLITAGMLHDIGKIYEYNYKKKIEISDRGRLLGHIVIGSEMISERIKQLADFPEDLAMRISHMILSHHGEVEWGSPKLPSFPEALALHYADNLDSKMEMMKQIFEKHRGTSKQWSDYHPYLDREIYLGNDT